MLQSARVVPLTPKHIDTHRGDDMGIVAEYKLGNTVVLINDSYLQNRTPQQIKIDQENLQKVAWEAWDKIIQDDEKVS